MNKWTTLIFLLVAIITSCQETLLEKKVISIRKEAIVVEDTLSNWLEETRAEYGDWPDSVLAEMHYMDSVLYALGEMGVDAIDYEQEEIYLQEVDLVQAVNLDLWQSTTAKAFKRNQKTFYKVQDLYVSNEDYIQKLLLYNGIRSYKIDLYLRAFKKEGRLEIWAKAKTEKQFKLLLDYPFYQGASKLGPKQREGDLQVPEGFYSIDYFNPESSYKVSLRINYPNAADSIRNATESKMGGSICIHGHYGSVGCLAITNLRIPNVYLLAIEAHDNGQLQLPVHIFPTKMTKANLDSLTKQYHAQPDLIDFWKSLEPAYTHFENTKELPIMELDAHGIYKLNESP